MTVQEREPSRVRGRENRVKFTRANGEEGICWSGGQPSQPPALEFCDGQWARLLTLAAHSMSFHGPVAVHQSKHLLFVSSRGKALMLVGSFYAATTDWAFGREANTMAFKSDKDLPIHDGELVDFPL